MLVDALDAMARTVGGGAARRDRGARALGTRRRVGALRGALRAKPKLAPGGVPAALIPDSVAALTALQTAPGLPAEASSRCVDLGGSGTSITLADATGGPRADRRNRALSGVLRRPDRPGGALNHVLAGVADANNADPAGTAAVGSLTRLRDECRQAKERLSAETATVRARRPARLPPPTSG